MAESATKTNVKETKTLKTETHGLGLEINNIASETLESKTTNFFSHRSADQVSTDGQPVVVRAASGAEAIGRFLSNLAIPGFDFDSQLRDIGRKREGLGEIQSGSKRPREEDHDFNFFGEGDKVLLRKTSSNMQDLLTVTKSLLLRMESCNSLPGSPPRDENSSPPLTGLPSHSGSQDPVYSRGHLTESAEPSSPPKGIGAPQGVHRPKARWGSARESSSPPGNSTWTELETEEAEEGDENSRKEKAVKVKKVFLRILRKVMEIPNESPLLLVWREGRFARKTGKQYPAGWYGIEVMDVEEVDAVLRKLVPEVPPRQVGAQDWTLTLAAVLQTTPQAVKQYVILKNCRYRLNEAALAPQALQRVKQVRAEMRRLHDQSVQNASMHARAPSFGDTPLLSCSQCGGIFEQCVCNTQQQSAAAQAQVGAPNATGPTVPFGQHHIYPSFNTLPRMNSREMPQIAGPSTNSSSFMMKPVHEEQALSQPGRRALLCTMGECFQRMWQVATYMDPMTLEGVARKICGLAEDVQGNNDLDFNSAVVIG